MRGKFLSAAILSSLAVPALAADLGPYPTVAPSSDSPLYSPRSFFSGEVGLTLGGYNPDPGDSEGLVAVNGSVTFPLWGSLYETIEAGAGANSADANAYGIGSHTYFHAGGWALGGFVGVVATEASGVEATATKAAVEGAMFFPNGTLLGMVGYTWPEAAADFWTFQGEYRHYVTPNDKLYGIVARNTEAPHWALVGGYEHLFAGTNVAGSAAAFWTGGSNEAIGGLLTISYLYGGAPSLQEVDNQRPFEGFTSTVANGLIFSDIRLKTDIVPVGRLDSGLGLYRYRYLWSDQEYVGVMAQEVAAVRPDAVVTGEDGYFRVDYGKLGIVFQTYETWLVEHL